jgi:hypothetical protein
MDCSMSELPVLRTQTLLLVVYAMSGSACPGYEILIRQELPMRCFLHLLSGDDTILDNHGLEISDLQEAEVQALMAIQEVRQEVGCIDEDLKGWHLHVVDGSGVTMLSIPLDALTQ